MIGAPLLRLRSDEQLLALFRAGHDEAFRAIHDRYRARLFAYTRQMLPASRQDAEDALQDVFLKAYYGLRASDRELALRAWLYRVAHNRCIDQLRRPVAVATATIETASGPATADPIAAAEQRETLRRLIDDVRRLPEHQRSALLMRELSGMSYAELGAALGLSVPAVKSVLVRARVSLAAALEARETACESIRDELADCHDRGVRPTPTARRHLRDCPGCRDFRHSVRSVSRDLHVLVPAVGPLGLLAKLLGLGIAGSGAAASGGGGGGAAAGGAAASGAAAAGSVAAASGLGAGGAIATGFMTTTAGHVATLLAAAIVTAGGAVEIQPALTGTVHHRGHPAHTARVVRSVSPGLPPAVPAAGAPATVAVIPPAAVTRLAPPASAPTVPAHRVAVKDIPTGGTSLVGTPPTGANSPTGSVPGVGGADPGSGTVPVSNGGSTAPGSTGVAGAGVSTPGAPTGAATGTTGSAPPSGTGTGTGTGTPSPSGTGSPSTGSPSSGSGPTTGTPSGTGSPSGSSGTSGSGATGSTGTSGTSSDSGSSTGTSAGSSSAGTTASPSGPRLGD